MKVHLFVLLVSLLWQMAVARAATVTVNITGFAFSPANQTIQNGDTVTWVNQDSITHTSTSGAPPTPDGAWDSGFLAMGQSFSHTFAAAGTFPYFCQVHTFMTGTINVQGSSTPPTVTITSPTNNATMSAPGSATIEASASAAGGATITQVEFFDGATSLGVDTTNPYSVTANFTAGTHTLTAKATDSAGASATSGAVTFTVGGGGTKINDPFPTKIPKGAITIDLQLALDGLVSPVGMAAPDDGSGRMFVVDQIGIIHVLQNGTNVTEPLLDVQSRLVKLNPNYDERGLLGVATHPNFAQHPFVYTYTSEPNGPMADFMIMYPDATTNNCQSVIAEWKIDPANPNRLDPGSRREILRIDKPQSNHNAGTMRFGPDGLLYFTVGDGGAADDQGNGHLPTGNAQDKTRILGKVSRIDVDGRNSANGQYGIPSDNPFVSEPGSLPEIYAYGLRNPYSFSFDRVTGDLYLGDVGQNQVEEVDRIVKGGNFGWNIKEGPFYFDPNGTNAGFVTTMPVREVPPDLIDPIAAYDHDEGEAVIGGYLYRGLAAPALSGKYVFADWGNFAAASGRLFYLDGADIKELRIGADDHPLANFVKGFGEDASGNVYVMCSTNLGPSGTSGKVFKIVAPPVARANSFAVTPLVSDLPQFAPIVDTNLVNPWGLARGPATPFWVSDNRTGVSTLYNSTGGVQSLVVTIPPPPGGTPPAAPTGVIFNDTTDFVVGSAAARFIFATEDGTIVGWNSAGGAVIKADSSASGAIYKGLTIANDHGANFLYAADFHGGKIDVFDATFQPVAATGMFVDPALPAGFAPFNVRAIGGNIYVTYAKQDADMEDDVPGPGNGYINVFDPSGHLLKRFASADTLNSPWGLTVAPASFGPFGGALLVGNFGDGRINAFDLATGALLGQLDNVRGAPISIEGLWDLTFGNGGNGGALDTLYFTAGIGGGGAIEDHGLFGAIAFEARFLITETTRDGVNLTIRWIGGTPPYVLQKKSALGDSAWTDVQTLTDTSATVTTDGGAGFFRVSSAANP